MTDWHSVYGKSKFTDKPQIQRARALFIIFLVMLILLVWYMGSMHFAEYNATQDSTQDVKVAEQESGDANVVPAIGDTESDGAASVDVIKSEEESDADEAVPSDGTQPDGEAASDESANAEGAQPGESATEEDASGEGSETRGDADDAANETESGSDWMGKYQNPPWQWWDWILASLVGVLLYLLANIAYYYQKAYRYYEKQQKFLERSEDRSIEYPSSEEELGPAEPKFINFTPWYISTIVKAPIVTIAILVLLTNIDFKFAGIEFDFTKLDAQVLLMIAFVLGFYSRVAREQLNVIVKALFGKAYSRAEEVFVVPQKGDVVFGDTCEFNTSPYTEVTWVVSGAGTIDSGGQYTAPAASAQAAGSAKSALITAVPIDPNIPRATAVVSLIPFVIIGPKEVGYAEQLVNDPFTVDPPQTVEWSFVGLAFGAKIDNNGILTGPIKTQVGNATYIIIRATNKADATQYAEFQVYFKLS